MAVRLYVGNLPYSVRDDELMKLFEEFGPVSFAQVIIDKMTKRSKGFGFVDVEDDKVEAAVAARHDYDMGGRKLIVNVARPKEERPMGDRGGFGGNRGGYGSRDRDMM